MSWRNMQGPQRHDSDSGSHRLDGQGGGRGGGVFSDVQAGSAGNRNKKGKAGKQKVHEDALKVIAHQTGHAEGCCLLNRQCVRKDKDWMLMSRIGHTWRLNGRFNWESTVGMKWTSCQLPETLQVESIPVLTVWLLSANSL